jgi:hypothetical protein
MTSKFASRVAASTLACLSTAIGAGSAMAQTPAQGLLNNSWVVNLGAFIVGTDFKANLNGQSSSQPEIDFDETFGRDSDATRVRADVLWRITPAHHVRFDYFNNTSNRSKVVNRDINWGDNTFLANGRVDSEVKMTVYELAYEWAFLKQPSYEVSATFGVHYSDVSVQLTGNATFTDANGNTSAAAATSKKSSIPAPLPVIGLRGGWAVSPQWYLGASGQFFKVNYGDYDGNWSNLRGNATWMFSKNFGVGLGYDRFVTRVDVSKSDFNGRLTTGYSGLQAYLTGTF